MVSPMDNRQLNELIKITVERLSLILYEENDHAKRIQLITGTIKDIIREAVKTERKNPLTRIIKREEPSYREIAREDHRRFRTEFPFDI